MRNTKNPRTLTNKPASTLTRGSRPARHDTGPVKAVDQPMPVAGADLVQSSPPDVATELAPATSADLEAPIIRITGDMLRASAAIKIEKGTKPKDIAAALLHFYPKRTVQAVHGWLGKYLGVETAPRRGQQPSDDPSPDLFSPFSGW